MMTMNTTEHVTTTTPRLAWHHVGGCRWAASVVPKILRCEVVYSGGYYYPMVGPDLIEQPILKLDDAQVIAEAEARRVLGEAMERLGAGAEATQLADAQVLALARLLVDERLAREADKAEAERERDSAVAEVARMQRRIGELLAERADNPEIDKLNNLTEEYRDE